MSGHVPSKVRVASLIDRGANPNACLDGVCALSMADNSAALRNASARGHMEVVELVLPVSDPLAAESYALRAAVVDGRLEVARRLLPVSDPRACESEALRSAAYDGHAELVALLLPVSDPFASDSAALKRAAMKSVRGGNLVIEALWPAWVGREFEFIEILRVQGADAEPYVARMERKALGEHVGEKDVRGGSKRM